MKTEVLVVGAGPVGLATAAELARYGVSVRIVERQAQRTDKSKALVIWSRTLEMMDRMGCSGRFIESGRRVTAANIIAGGTRIARLTLDGVATPHPYGLMLPQSDTERLMEEHLNSLGVRVERTVELARFEPGGERVASTLRRSDGSEETLDAEWLIGCDGAHSTVRHQLGMEFLGRTMENDWILADVHLEGDLSSGELDIVWHSDGILALFPLGDGRFRVVCDSGNAGAAPRGEPTLEEVQALIDRRGLGGLRASDPVWLATFRINERKVAHYRKGRVFLAGDAAHVHSPAGGQGMNTGIQDGCNLAWKLALVCRGTCGAEPLLGSYSAERSAVGKRILQATGIATRVGVLRGRFQQSLRNRIAWAVMRFAGARSWITDMLTEVSIAYGRGPLCVQGARGIAGPAAGERAPIRGDESPVGAGTSPRFVLYAAPGTVPPGSLEQFPELLEQEIRPAFSDAGLWLVRPDGYVALATRAGCWNEVAAFMDALGGPGAARGKSA